MPKSKLSTMAFAVLRQEIHRRQKLLPKLIAQRDALSRKIAELQTLAAPKRTRRRRRAKNTIGLADALVAFLKGKAKVTVAQAMDGVLAAGYKTTSRDFRKVVNKTLLDDKRIKNVARGVFALKA